MAGLVANSKVVLSAAGPFWKIGSILVEECAKAGVHYCDITGETAWVKELIDNGIDKIAKDSGAKIVPFCGLDCIPSDLGCQLMADEMRKKHSCGCSEVTMYIGPSSGGISGGTIASIFNMFERPTRDVLSLLSRTAQPYFLNPPGTEGPPVKDQRGVWYSSDMKKFTAPWLMAGVNTRVVRRSNALLGNAYGANLKYSEAVINKLTFFGFVSSLLISLMLPLFFLLVLLPPTRVLLRKVLPKPGDGPPLEKRQKGFFKFFLVAKGDSKDLPVLRGTISAPKDPGYGATAVMAAEAALCLAQDGDRLTRAGGLLTAASAMGPTLLQRLNKAGISFQLDGAKPDGKQQ